jgi:adenosylhomocysteine nucleosidase
MRVLVTFAVEAEFAPWRRMREFAEKQDGNSTIYTARSGESEIDVLLTGIGRKSAWLETAKKVWNGDVNICISSGLAGALRPEYRPGEILAARVVHAAGTGKAVSCDGDLMRLALENGGREVGSFYSVDEVILSANEKSELGKSYDAVEMESGEVLCEMAAPGARVIAIRGISDAAEEDLPLDFNRVTTSTGEVSLSRVLREVARHPTAVPALIRFGRQSQVAAERLGEFLDRYVEAVVTAGKSLPKKVGTG